MVAGRSAAGSQALALRARIVMLWAEGATIARVAEKVGASRNTVSKWRSRFLARSRPIRDRCQTTEWASAPSEDAVRSVPGHRTPAHRHARRIRWVCPVTALSLCRW
ncbi:helix-turn-helix domain-containing protein [Actinomadura verrucosospora]|uniref:helix-turn-helix domain-containing protein n=1 Tax=Actinomadura verrucosospora TaxID=46165 RepID=UPI0031EED2F2